jgi:hypothetical protein
MQSPIGFANSISRQWGRSGRTTEFRAPYEVLQAKAKSFELPPLLPEHVLRFRGNILLQGRNDGGEYG